MAGPTWARAEVQVTADGSSLPREMRALGTLAGAEGGEAAGKSFDKSFSQSVRDGVKKAFNNFTGFFKGLWSRIFRKGGKTVGDGFTAGFKDSMKSFRLEFDKVSTDVVRQSQEMARTVRDVDFGRWAEDFGEFAQVFRGLGNGFRDQLAIGPGALDDIGELRQVFDEAGDSARSASGDFKILWRELEAGDSKVEKSHRSWTRLNKVWTSVGTALRSGGGIGGGLKKLWGAFDDGEGRLTKHASLWKNLSANTRQWTLIIGAVIGSIGQLAGLGSAAGSGLFVLGSALGLAGAAAVFAGVAFARFMGDIKKVPKELRPARKAFDGFKSTFGDLMDAMTVTAFKDTTEAWNTLAKTVERLRPAFTRVGEVVSGLINDLSVNLDTETIDNMNGALSFGADILDSLVRALGRLGKSLVSAFNNPQFQRSVKEMIGWITDLTDSFAEFLLDTDGGFTEWLEHGRAVFGALGGLLETTGALLDELVTDESIKQLTDFIGHIDGFLQGGGRDLLLFAQKLDVFGLVAKALDEFGKALEPLAGPMGDFAEALNTIVNLAIDDFADGLKTFADAMAPMVQNVADFMKANPKLFADALLAIAAGFAAIKLVGIAKAITAPLGGFVGLMTGKNTGKMAKFAAGIGGITLALQGLSEQNKEGGGLEGGGLGVLETIGGGALAGSAFGPIGLAIGALGGAIASMIQDMFLSPDIEGAWKTGWDQLFDMSDTSGAGIGQVKQFFIDFDNNVLIPFWTVTVPGFFTSLGASFALGWEQITTGLGTAWETVRGKFELGWQQISDFFTITIPKFFADLGANLQTGLLTLAAIVGTLFTPLIDKFKLGWQQIVNFFTVELPRFFSDIWTRFTTGLGRLGEIVTEKWNEIKGNFTRGWQQITNWWNVELPRFFSEAGANWTSFWSGFPDAVGTAVGEITGFLQGLWAPIQDAINWFNSLWGAADKAESKGRTARNSGSTFASGGLLMGPRRILAGEAGPEAIVPLKRNLSQVDPSVRWLSAIAQGQNPAFAGGGVITGGRTVNVAEGAIQIRSTDPWRAANEAINQIVERAAS